MLSLAVIAFALVTGSGAPRPPEPRGAHSSTPDMAALLAAATARVEVDDGSSRPAYRQTAPEGIDRSSPPSVAVAGVVRVKHTQWRGRALPHLYPSAQLPFRYHVERTLVERFGLDAIIEGAAAWDGVPGSRWATDFAGIVDGPNRRRGDGRSVIYLRRSCPARWLGYAVRNYAPGTAVLDVRYGSAAIYSAEVDIGICPTVGDREELTATLAHEIGHAMGLAHLCEPGRTCAEEVRPAETGPDEAPPDECRPMRAIVQNCGGLQDRDRQAARHLHPTLPRLAGPTAVETAARASYATTGTQEASVVVLAPAGDDQHAQVLAAALAGFVDGPLLLDNPDAAACVTGAARRELLRVARRAADVLLVGRWPDRCETILGSWGLHVERFDRSYSVGMSVQVADRIAASGRMQDTATILSARPDDSGLLADAMPAAASAHGGPLLFTHPRQLSPLVARWLREHPQIDRVYLMGNRADTTDRVVRALTDLGLEIVRLAGVDAIQTAAATAEIGDLVPPGGPVVLSSVRSSADGAVAASLAARLRAPLLLTDRVPHPTVERVLRERAPQGGYLVGGPDALPWELQWAYAEHVTPAETPVPSQGDSPGQVLLQAAVQRFFPNVAGG